MPTNLYGPGDNFDLTTSHVIPALMRKAHEAKMRGDRELVIWGTGTPRREFLHVDDAADALVHLMTHYSGATHVNVGVGSDLTILELAKLIAGVVGFTGEIVTDPARPDGTPRKLLDVSKLQKSWLAPQDRARGRPCQHLRMVCKSFRAREGRACAPSLMARTGHNDDLGHAREAARMTQ